MRGLLVASLAFLSACAGDKDPYAERFLQLSAEHYRQVGTPEGAAWERALLPAHNAIWPGVHDACSGQARSAGITEFKALAVVGRDGVVDAFLLMPRSPHLACYEKQMVGRRYPAPPEAPFHELFELRIGAD